MTSSGVSRSLSLALDTPRETVHVDGFRLKPRGHGWGSTTCEPQACLARRDETNRTAALRELLVVDPNFWRPLAPVCTDGAGGADAAFDVGLHVRAITKDFEVFDAAHEAAYHRFAERARLPRAWNASRRPRTLSSDPL